MIDKLKELHKNSYSPYSNYKVSAIVVMKDKKEYNGVNVENVSYGATICAERTAIFSAIADGYKKGDFEKLYIMASSNEIAMPCFLCRQVISELFDKNSTIHCCTPSGEEKIYSVSELCPYPFEGKELT